ncbi:hypothetical protein PVAND_006359 [Polypedilum vanderplanki]|uniref:Peptidase C1A papain C-terminal domain-containing protein n=1 Tax=Polypedilum vanderplanki TaxID=319348 RepID=A0A9J6C3Q3_POLVA|nr:hypothetical protein PVAND_006359 [Polypedilum vanderplanki]
MNYKLIFISSFLLISQSTQLFIDNPKLSTWMMENGEKFFNLSESILTKVQQSVLDNLQIIEKHNKEVSDFILGLNEFSDLDKKEFVKCYCKTVMPKQFLPDRPKLARAKALNNFTIDNLPESFSWKEHFERVKMQGKCGSCYAFSVTSMLEAMNKKKNSSWNYELSPQYILDCDSKNDGCDGGWPAESLMFLKYKSKNEAPTLENYPYIKKQKECKMTGFPKVKLNIDEVFEFKFRGDEKQMRLHLVNYGPLVITMHVNDDTGLFQNYKKGIFYEKECSNDCKIINHAMVLIGYGVTNDDEKKPYYLVLNSWGKSWGEEGYIRMAADRGNNCNVACFGVVAT